MGIIVEIINYSEEYKEWIKILNYEWLEQYFIVEEGDILTLSNPQNHILDKGGHIFYAKYNGSIVGTASLLKKENNIYELGKMAVNKDFQGKGVGNQLLEFCLNFAKENHYKALILYSNTQLKSAIHLYKKYGFAEIEMEKGLYERANFKMIKYF